MSESEALKDSAIKLFGRTILTTPQQRHCFSASSPSLNNKEVKQQRQVKLKKPEKILPCPRCNSAETKFCHFNNYNVNQPRYFCKNCQRFWTSGGSMRNVPIGSGRRKSKILGAQTNFLVVGLGYSESGFVSHRTMKIDDPMEAAKSSVWSTMGIKNNGMCFSEMAFDSRGKRSGNTRIDSVAMALRANPAALSRSMQFQEDARISWK